MKRAAFSARLRHAKLHPHLHQVVRFRRRSLKLFLMLNLHLYRIRLNIAVIFCLQTLVWMAKRMRAPAPWKCKNGAKQKRYNTRLDKALKRLYLFNVLMTRSLFRRSRGHSADTHCIGFYFKLKSYLL